MKRRVWLSVIMSFIALSVLGTASGEDPRPPKKTRALVITGKALYEKNCTPCHGSNGDGNTPIANSLNPRPTNFTRPLQNWPNTKGDPEKIFDVISKGIPGSAMIAWNKFSEKERWGLVYFVMEFSTEKK